MMTVMQPIEKEGEMIERRRLSFSMLKDIGEKWGREFIVSFTKDNELTPFLDAATHLCMLVLMSAHL